MMNRHAYASLSELNIKFTQTFAFIFKLFLQSCNVVVRLRVVLKGSFDG